MTVQRQQTTQLLDHHLDQAGPRRSHWLDLPARRSSVGIARHRLTEQLNAWSLPEPTVDDAVLLVSELATNAVVHTAGTRMLCGVALSPDGRLRIEVHDDHDAPCAAPGSPDPDDESGRGLLIVRALADAWGVQPSPTTGGKVVWATLGTAADDH
ncbi:ATP-binding protein [Streptacidiphilus pinicola]|uniref:ATP-binding protein n=1 Tax=Streptacidiphilus pinicola TaxID=2219663 RepID=UPI001FB360D9|nr:ATP-binding protein [Streptacidiphilus pinicola]